MHAHRAIELINNSGKSLKKKWYLLNNPRSCRQQQQQSRRKSKQYTRIKRKGRKEPGKD